MSFVCCDILFPKNGLGRHLPTVVGMLVMAALGGAAQSRADEPDSEQILGVLASGYANNRDAFQFIDCRFEAIRGTVADFEKAQRGELAERKLVRTGQWLVNRDLVRYELLCDPEVTETVEKQFKETVSKKATDGNPFSVPCLDSIFLSQTGKHGLSYVPLSLTANIFTQDDPHSSAIRVTPFSMDVMGPDEYSNPARYIQDALRGRWEGRFVGVEKSVTGRQMMVCEIGPKGRVRLGFDAERGYMLTMMADNYSERDTRLYIAHVLDAKQCQNGAWFPTRTVTVWDPDEKGPFRADTIRVLELDTDLPPASERFVLDLATDVQVNRAGHPEWVNLKKSESVSVQDLASLHQRCIDHGREEMARQAQIQKLGQRQSLAGSSTFNTRLIIAGNLMVIFLVAGIFVFRKSKKKPV